ncbi:MAG: 30S ribosomal protein S8 [Candidatus Pacebacteria bacterium]|jgi:small subunit ribosomal protein S8|nr:30S ribosomal protein S8 [Candidatus Paceibacterota bacterium]MDD4994578.1 30S ribosomal protein S8 [Candidatus Paceibacterota bacterium]MDD5535204.1 30S ribosomal protein S8 [Candidatus Paceibacterota bacterium]
MTDPIADMLTRIRNAQAVNKKTVVVPYSKIKLEILNVLLKNNFIIRVEKVKRKTRSSQTETGKKFIEIEIKYDKENQPLISEMKRISKPSRRVYLQAKDIWPFKRGLGLRILSTPRGILSDMEAKKLKVGGEVLLEVW